MTDFTELNNHINAAKTRFIEKMNEHILKIDNELNIKIDYSITETANSVIVSGVDTYSYFASKWFPSKIDPNVKMVFNSHSNPYLEPNTSKSLLIISLNDDFDITLVQLKNWIKQPDGKYTDTTLTFDNTLESELGVILS
jgi:hypothetical protein